MNSSSNIFDNILAIIIIPVIIIIILIVAPLILILLLINNIFNKYIDKLKLKKLLKLNNGKIYFIYSDYNSYDFLSVFKEKYKDIECVKVNERVESDLLIRYLIKDRISKCYPSLIKIEGDTLIIKEHYNSFKKLYKKENNIESFFDLIEKSMNNLRR